MEDNKSMTVPKEEITEFEELMRKTIANALPKVIPDFTVFLTFVDLLSSTFVSPITSDLQVCSAPYYHMAG